MANNAQVPTRKLKTDTPIPLIVKAKAPAEIPPLTMPHFKFLSSLLFFDAPFKSYIIISPIIALFVAAFILRFKK